MTVLIDMDDVLEKLVDAWVIYTNEHFGTHVAPEDVTDWNMSLAFPELTFEQAYAAEMDDEFWKTVQPMPGADEALRKMIADGHEIYIVTSSYYQTLKSKADNVLFKYYPYLRWEQVIISFNKAMIKGDVLIDDGPHNFRGGEYKKILFDAFHNRSFDEKSVGAVRVKNWEGAYAEVCRIAEELGK